MMACDVLWLDRLLFSGDSRQESESLGRRVAANVDCEILRVTAKGLGPAAHSSSSLEGYMLPLWVKDNSEVAEYRFSAC